MRLAVIGSRSLAEGPGAARAEALVRVRVRAAHRRFGDHLVIVSGGARGPDTWGVDEAVQCGLTVKVWPAQWRAGGVYNPGAGMLRNAVIIGDVQAVLAFLDWEPTSGTLHSIGLARRRDLPTAVYRPDGTLDRTLSHNLKKGS